MRFSIITVTFNAESSLPKTIDSIRKQTYKDIELIVIDGKSTDNTVSVIESNKDIITNYLSEKDSGIYDAMNKGINRASGDFCLFLNAGDLLCSDDVLKNVKQHILKNPDYDLYIGYADYVKGSHITTKKPNLSKLPYTFCHQAMFYRTSVIIDNQYNTFYCLSGDSELLYRMIDRGYKYCLIDVKVVLEEDGVGATASNLMSSTNELYSIPFLVQHTSPIYRFYRKFKIAMYLFLVRINMIKV